MSGLCDLYQVPEQDRRELLEYARKSAQSGWWEPYKEGVSPRIRAFVETEAEMAALRTLELELIPALLQTEQYLRELQSALVPVPDEEVRAVRALRRRRQENVFARTGPDAPSLSFLIGRHSLMYLDCLGAAGKEQMAHIVEAAGLPNVEIRILNRLHPAMLCSFTILTPGPPLPGSPFVFIEAVDGGRYEEGRDVVSLYERTFQAAWEVGAPLKEYLDDTR